MRTFGGVRGCSFSSVSTGFGWTCSNARKALGLTKLPVSTPGCIFGERWFGDDSNVRNASGATNAVWSTNVESVRTVNGAEVNKRWPVLGFSAITV